MNNTQFIQSILSNALPLLQRKYPLQSLALFGSQARGEQTSTSDIDILVELNGEMDWNYFDLCYEIQALFPGQKVDVVSKGAIEKPYWEFIKQDLVYA